MKSTKNSRMQKGLAQGPLTGLALTGLALTGLLMGAMTSLGCDDPGSKEDLNPAGPPMIRQVFMTEKLVVNESPRTLEGQIAFGQHENEFFKDDDGAVTTAIALGSQEIRVVFDELIRGNSLEEIGCADGTFSVIPEGTTPDDISKCAGPVDSLQKCTKVCLDGSGKPIGVLDEDDNSSADKFRMRDYNPDPNVVELGVSLICDGVIVPLDQEFSFWSPAGNQTFPSNATLGFRGIGPALVLKPVAASGLRTGAKCEIKFRPEVTDYDGNTICAPTNGLPKEGCEGGDTSKIYFNTEVLALAASTPKDADMNVAITASAFMLLSFNANLDASTAAQIKLSTGGVDVPVTPMVQDDDPTGVVIMMATDFLPATEYKLTIGAGLTDALGGTQATPAVVTFKTAPAAL